MRDALVVPAADQQPVGQLDQRRQYPRFIRVLSFMTIAPVVMTQRVWLVFIYTMYYGYGWVKGAIVLRDRWGGENSVEAERGIFAGLVIWAVSHIMLSGLNGILSKMFIEGSFSGMWADTFGMLLKHFSRSDADSKYPKIATTLFIASALSMILWAAGGLRLYLGCWSFFLPDGTFAWNETASTMPPPNDIPTLDEKNPARNVVAILFSIGYPYAHTLWSLKALLVGTVRVIDIADRFCGRRLALGEKSFEKAFIGEPLENASPFASKVETQSELIMYAAIGQAPKQPSHPKCTTVTFGILRAVERLLQAASRWVFYTGGSIMVFSRLAQAFDMTLSDTILDQVSVVFATITTLIDTGYHFACQEEMPDITVWQMLGLPAWYNNYPKPHREEDNPNAEEPTLAATQVVLWPLMAIWFLTMACGAGFQALIFYEPTELGLPPGQGIILSGVASSMDWMYSSWWLVALITIPQKVFELPAKLEKAAGVLRPPINTVMRRIGRYFFGSRQPESPVYNRNGVNAGDSAGIL